MALMEVSGYKDWKLKAAESTTEENYSMKSLSKKESSNLEGVKAMAKMAKRFQYYVQMLKKKWTTKKGILSTLRSIRRKMIEDEEYVDITVNKLREEEIAQKRPNRETTGTMRGEVTP